MNQQEMMQALLAQVSERNPEKAQLLRQMMEAQRQGHPPEREEGNAKVKGQLKRLAKMNAELKLHLHKLKKQKQALLSHLEFFLAVNQEFAGAVGACPCWGLDEDCECQDYEHPLGKRHHPGSAGTYEISSTHFKRYVAPCLEQLSPLSAEEPSPPVRRRVPAQANLEDV